MLKLIFTITGTPEVGDTWCYKDECAIVAAFKGDDIYYWFDDRSGGFSDVETFVLKFKLKEKVKK